MGAKCQIWHLAKWLGTWQFLYWQKRYQKHCDIELQLWLRSLFFVDALWKVIPFCSPLYSWATIPWPPQAIFNGPCCIGMRKWWGGTAYPYFWYSYSNSVWQRFFEPCQTKNCILSVCVCVLPDISCFHCHKHLYWPIANWCAIL